MASTPSKQPMARGARVGAAPAKAKAKSSEDAEIEAMLAGLT